MKKGEEGYSAAQMASIRICIAALCLLPVAIKHFKRLTRKQLFYISLFGLCNAGLPAFLFAEAETVVSSSTAGILNSLAPIFTLLFGIILFRQAINWNGLIGVLIGFAGACLLIFYGTGNEGANLTSHAPWIYSGMIVVATLGYGIANNIIKKHLQDVPGYIVSAFSYLVFAIPLVFWLFFFSDFQARVFHHPHGLSSLGFICLLAIFGSAIAIILYVRLVQVSNALFGSLVTYLMPIVSVLWGIFANEKMNYITIVSLVIILTGIIIASQKKARIKAESPDLEPKESF
jgi:drug/metabolite transporter (DMT)-like permease